MGLRKQLSFPSKESHVIDFLLSQEASYLDEYSYKSLISGRNKIFNLSTSNNPSSLLYVTEERIKHKFSSPPDFMRFSFPRSCMLLPPSDSFYSKDIPLAYINVVDAIENYCVSDTASFVNSFAHETLTSYRVNIHNLFVPSASLEKTLFSLRK